MPPRQRLPVINPAAEPAPKCGRQQHGAQRTSFWKSESDQYWEKCRHIKRSRQRKAVGLTAVVVVVSLMLLAAGLRGRRTEPVVEEEVATSSLDLTGELTTSSLEEAAPADDSGVTNGLRLKTLACVGSGKKHELESKTCAKVCAKARTTAPRPLAHRSCLAGCRAGVTTAWDTACVGGRHRDCVRESTERCDLHCASYRNQFPKPTIFNQCLRSCLDVVDTTCLKSKEVFASAETFDQ
ncbi:unnamed protein product [Ectocarpus sp. 4 AP-2014]